MRLIERPQIQQIAAALGRDSELHVVGGCVRDDILGVEPKDIDLTTVLHPDEVEHRLAFANIPSVVTGIRRGTITAILNGEPFEITTFRNPANEKEFVDNIETDLAARDFTINAVAINVFTGAVVDPFHGVDDILTGRVICVGSAERRFTEDPHRILRMIRFGFGAGRSVDEETIATAKRLVHLISTIAPERIHDEFIKIVCSRHPGVAISMLQSIGALKIILPELENCVGIGQNKHHLFDVFEHTLAAITSVRNDKILRLAALFHDIAKPSVRTIDNAGSAHFYGHEEVSAELTKNIMFRMKFSNADIDSVVALVSRHGFNTECGDSAIRRLIRDVGENAVFSLIELKRADGAAGHVNNRKIELDNFEARVRAQIEHAKANPFVAIAIDGNDVMGLGVREGPEVGRLLKMARELVLENPEKNDRNVLMAFVGENMR